MAKSGKMKTSTKVLLGAGGVAALGGIAYALWRKSKATSKDEDVGVDSTRVEATSTTASRKSTTATASAGAKAQAGAVAVKTLEPKGWLGALIAHGGACMGFEIEYMTGSEYGKHYHLSPILMAHYQKFGGGIDLNMDDSRLLTNRYQEFPCPVYPQTTPHFLLHGTAPTEHNGGTIDEWKSAAGKGEPAANASHWIKWGLDSELWLSGWNAEGNAPSGWGIRVGDGGYLEHRRNSSSASWGRVYPGKRVADWALHQSIYGANNIGRDNGLSTTIGLMNAQVPGGMNRAVIVPEYYRKNKQRLHEWYGRLLGWYYTARWLVWAGEMLRIHAHVPRPAWWKTHVALWAIGTPGTQRVKRPSYDDAGLLSPKLPTGGTKVVKDSGLRVMMTADEVNQILRAIIKHTWPPGTKGATGQQISPKGIARTLCDIPISAGSVAPPIDLLDDLDRQIWAIYAVSKFQEHEKYMPWEKWYKLGVNVVTSCISAGLGGAVSAAISTLSQVTQQLIMTTVTFALQAVTKLGTGSMSFGTEDIVGLMGNLLNASGLKADVIKSIPQELWPALKTAGATIPFLSGTDWEQVRPQLQMLQLKLEAIQILDKWGYADAAYGGLGLSGNVRDAAGSALN